MKARVSWWWIVICGLRSFIFYMGMAIICLLFFPVLLLVSPCSMLVRVEISRMFCWLVVHLARWVCGIRYRVQGQEYLLDTPVIFMINHQSAWEIFYLFQLLPLHVYVLKKELFKIPIFGWGLRLSGPIAINRNKAHGALKYLIREGQKRIQLGLSISVFPEGKRYAPGVLGDFHQGAALLAVTARVPVIPIAHNAGWCWPARTFIKYPGEVEVIIGSPILTQDLSVQQIKNLAYEYIRDTMRKIEYRRLNQDGA